MKILSIVGARPQFIKAAAISRIIKNFNYNHIILHTGQHFDDNMNQVFFEEMSIPMPKYNLGIASLSHGAMTGRMIEKIEEVLLEEKTDWVIIYGDTNSTLAGAIAAKKLHLKVAHIEAGLRSFNMKMPEEQNRILADRISDILFCPTQNSMNNLQNEGIINSAYGQKAFLVGDVMFDAAIYYSKNINDDPKRYILATIHRAENTNNKEKLTEIMTGLDEIAKDIEVILPLHPRTRQKMDNLGLKLQNIQIISPVSYLEMIKFLKQCEVVITDSGGLQKEAYFFRKPCLTIRNETEWVELVEQGVNILVNTNKKEIIGAFHKIRNIAEEKFNVQMYGDGDACKKIIKILVETCVKES